MDDKIQAFRQPMVTATGIILGFVLNFVANWVKSDSPVLDVFGDEVLRLAGQALARRQRLKCLWCDGRRATGPFTGGKATYATYLA